MSSQSNEGRGGSRGRGGPYRWGRGSWRGRGWRGHWRGRGSSPGRGRGYGGVNRQDQYSSSSQSQARVVQTSLTPCPFPGWKVYFPSDAYTPGSPTANRVNAFIRYFHRFTASWSSDILEEVELRGSVGVNFATLVNDGDLEQLLPSWVQDLREQPAAVLPAMGLAMHEVMTKAQANSGLESTTFPQVAVRILNYEPMTPLKSLKAPQYGKFVAIRGTVVRVSNIKPLVMRLAFQCNTCATEQVLVLPDGKYVFPTKCPGERCRSHSFSPLRSSPLTETTDWQTVRIQELSDFGEEQREAGRIPRTVEVELTADMVDSCVPGDLVSVAAIVKASGIEDNRGKAGKDKCTFVIYLEANSIANSKADTSRSADPTGKGSHMEFSVKDLYAVQKIQAEDNVFRLIVNSLCPAIYGHELVKAGLALGLFGGTQKFAGDKNRIPVRGDPHVLVVGDPGLGKSQMLQAVSNLAPRGVYVCGNTTTTSGLTVTLSKDGGSGDYALEAGALVLADQGCCCIDEFDKMGSQHQALLEAMEQQSISIAKAGIVCSLPARTSILAAANPVGGHYNKAKTVSENLKMGSALLSRFDLVFILLDKPDEELDWMLSEHVMALHAGRKKIPRTPLLPGQQAEANSSQSSLWNSDKPLSDRLKVVNDEDFDPLPAPLLRKYVQYARKYVQPKLSSAAASVLQKFYLDLRKNHDKADSTPITARQLESLIRLSEARARLELCEEVTQHHAEEVVEIMKHSMLDTFCDDIGMLDFRRSQHGSGMSKAAQAKQFVARLSEIAEQTYNSLFSVQQLKQIAQEMGIQVRSLDDFISSLNNQGYLLKKGPRVYQLQTASCL